MTSDDMESGPRRTQQADWGPRPPGHITIRAIVNGMATDVSPGPDAPLRAVVELALRQTGNEGRPVEEWTVTNDLGRPLDAARNVGELGLEDFDTIFIQVEVGAGG
jgi:hypothetical protein